MIFTEIRETMSRRRGDEEGLAAHLPLERIRLDGFDMKTLDSIGGPEATMYGVYPVEASPSRESNRSRRPPPL